MTKTTYELNVSERLLAMCAVAAERAGYKSLDDFVCAALREKLVNDSVQRRSDANNARDASRPIEVRRADGDQYVDDTSPVSFGPVTARSTFIGDTNRFAKAKGERP